MRHRLKVLQIQKLALEQAEEVFYHGIVQTVALTAHALSDTFLLEHPLVLPVLVLPALVRMEDKTGSIWYLLKSLVQHRHNHAQDRTV